MEDLDLAPETSLGACCACGGREGVVTLVMLPLKGTTPGCGWGCVVCGLSMDGAVAVLCNGCVGDYATGRRPVRFACEGYPADDVRVPVADLGEPHEHDLSIEH